MLGKHTNTVLALAAFVAVGVFMPGMENTTRQLSIEESTAVDSVQHRRVQTSATPPAGFEFTCPPDEEMVIVDWSGITMQEKVSPQDVTLDNGMVVTLTTSTTGTADIAQYKKIPEGIIFTATVSNPTDDYVIPKDPTVTMDYPESFITLEIKLPTKLKDLFISVGDVDATSVISDATRIRFYDDGNEVPMQVASNSNDVKQQGNWAYNQRVGAGVSNPGYDHSLYAKATGYVDTIRLDQTVLIFPDKYTTLPSKTGRRGVFPALDFRMCSKPITAAPVTAAPVTAAPVTAAPVAISTACPAVSVETDDFESGTTDWENGKVKQNDGKFGTYLGPYTNKDFDAGTFPFKTFAVAPGADLVTVEFDFLEIDSWDGKSNNDSLTIEINGFEVVLAYYNWKVDEDTFSGETNGITWKSVAQGPPEKLGGTEKWVDQIHHITLDIPEAAFIRTNTIDLVLKIRVNSDVGDESGGFDNFSVTSFNCNGGGVNGDPLIMGLAGQLFKFDGRNGAWYSAVSSKSFQWNMKINEYDNCPADSNKFVGGVGFTLFKNGKTGRQPAHKIAVNVVNEFGVQTGCGTDSTNCLANGSLELIIDDKKFVYPGDYQFKDGTGRVVAFNTYYECSRKWYDFDITPVEEETGSNNLRANRRLATFPGVFDVVRDLENTMVDKDVCDQWITERQTHNDLFKQAGEWSTIIVKTDDISFHIEYKQEHKRCDAHTVDVWIASVSPDLYDEDWEGVIGETKDPSNHAGEKIERDEFLKFPNDDQYEVTSPFSTKCDGCYHN